jgi:D-3-phosphoglycerate dehydrogenase / 2-oxoglutarate reductase
MAGSVLIACKVHPVLTDRLCDLGYVIDVQESVTRAYVETHIANYTGIITSTRLELDRDLLQRAENLRWIGRMGSGMEIIDTNYAATRNIRCFSSPDGNCNAVGEHTLGLLLALTRKIVSSHNQMVSGIWQRDPNRGIELEGRTIGIIGFGHAGAAFAGKLSGFDVRILAYDKYHPEKIIAPAILCQTIDELLASAEIISFHVPLQSDTANYLNDDFVNRMARPFILLNASRGGVVDLASVRRGLDSGKIIGAGLDVFADEPPFISSCPSESVLAHIATLPQVVLTPHIAGYSFEAIYKMSASLVRQLV